MASNAKLLSALHKLTLFKIIFQKEVLIQCSAPLCYHDWSSGRFARDCHIQLCYWFLSNSLLFCAWHHRHSISINNCSDIRDTGLLLCSETLLGRGSGQMKDAFIYTQKSLSLAKNKEKGNTEKDHDNLMRICSFEGTRLGLTVVVLHHYSRLYCTSF